MSKYQVVWLHSNQRSGENYGNHVQRVQRPCELWQDDEEFHVQAVDVAEFDAFALALAADLLLLIQVFSAPVLALVRQRRVLGRPTIFEINDDFSALGGWVAAAHPLRSPLVRQHLLNAAQACDGLQFSSSALMQRYRTLHDCASVLDPYLPLPPTVPQKPDGFIIGWAGTTSHFDDLSAVLPSLRAFLENHRDCRFAMMGHASIAEAVLAQLPADQVDWRAFGSDAELQDFLSGLHVGIAPLQDTAFNRGRSDGKFVQYAAAGCVALLSDAPTFAMHRERACLFDSPAHMYSQLQTLYAQRAALAEYAHQAFVWVEQERSAAAIESVMRRQFRLWLGSRMPLPALARWSSASELAYRWSQLRAAEREKPSELLIDCCKQVLQLAPNCYAARCLLLQQLNALGRYAELLVYADAAADDAVYGDELASFAYAVAKKINSKLQYDFFQRIRHDAYKIRAAGVGPEGAEAYFRAILQHYPYDYFALFALIKCIESAQLDDPSLPALLNRAQLLMPPAASV